MTRSNRMSDLVTLVAIVLAIAALIAATNVHAQAYCCIIGDNGNGTVDMPSPCVDGYVGNMHIVEGLPAGSTIELAVRFHDFVGNEAPGGGLGGTTTPFTAELHFEVHGTGALAGFMRTIGVPVSGVMDFAPRTPGQAEQPFAGDLVSLHGELFGDPDFCTLEVMAGSDFGLPSPGHTLLSRVGGPGTDFQVDSFFDIAYTIDFQGCPGSILDGMGGRTIDETRLDTCLEPVPVRSRSWSAVKGLFSD